MIAAASVNVRYLLILVLPSAAVIIVTAITWMSRTKRQGGPEVRRKGGNTPTAGGPAARAKPAKPRSSGPAKRRRR
jgi:hypothetical protein